jgi:misacylated tRNA(Ala) deacylase
MSRYFCHLHPETLTLRTEALDARPGRVRLAQSPFYPGGGGQPADQGVVRWSGGETGVTGVESINGQTWHLLADPAVEIAGAVEAAVDPTWRHMMRELHTATHILNALVYRSFAGALVTGAQMMGDGTARIDFDLHDVDNDRLRALDAPMNDAIRQNLPLDFAYVPYADARAEPGTLRSRSVAPPPSEDGMVRIVEIVGLDRQACGGTHLASTGDSRPIRVTKIDNKGRHNRRIRIALVGGPALPA